jgi:hypothetical protein
MAHISLYCLKNAQQVFSFFRFGFVSSTLPKFLLLVCYGNNKPFLSLSMHSVSQFISSKVSYVKKNCKKKLKSDLSRTETETNTGYRRENSSCKRHGRNFLNKSKQKKKKRVLGNCPRYPYTRFHQNTYSRC